MAGGKLEAFFINHSFHSPENWLDFKGCGHHRMTEMDPFDVLHSRISVSGACSPNNVLASYFIIFAGTMFGAVWRLRRRKSLKNLFQTHFTDYLKLNSGNTKPAVSHKNNKNV